MGDYKTRDVWPKTHSWLKGLYSYGQCKIHANLNKHINTKHPNLIKSNTFKCKLCDWISVVEQLIRYYMIDHCENVMTADQHDVNQMKEVTLMMSRIEESNNELQKITS